MTIVSHIFCYAAIPLENIPYNTVHVESVPVLKHLAIAYCRAPIA